MLVELKAVEQRYRAVIDVLDGMSVTDVARRNEVSRQTRAHLAAALCRRRHGRPGRQELEARELPAPDGSAHRGPGDRAAP